MPPKILEESQRRLDQVRKEVEEFREKERKASGSPHSLHKLLPPAQPNTALASPRDIQLLAKQRDQQLQQEYEAEYRKMALVYQQQYNMQKQQLALQYKHHLYEGLEKRQKQREMKAREDMMLARKGLKKEDVIVVTIASVPGHKVKEVCGTVTGSHVARAIPEDVTDEEARQAVSLSRDEAYADLLTEAQKLHANAVVSFRWHSRSIGYEAVEMLATGTALRVEHDGSHSCNECGTTKKGGGGGGKGKGKGEQNQQKGGGGKGKNKGKHNDGSEEESEDENDEEEEGSDGEKSTKKGGKGGGGGGGKGGKGGKNGGGSNLSSNEQLIKLLLEARIKDDKKTQSERQRDQLMHLLDGFFANQSKQEANGFRNWLNGLENDNKGGNKNGNDGNNSSGNNGGNHGNNGGGGWGNNKSSSNQNNSQSSGSWGNDNKKNESKATGGWGNDASDQKKDAEPSSQKQNDNGQKGQNQNPNKNNNKQQQQGKKGGKQAEQQDKKDAGQDAGWGDAGSSSKDKPDPAQPNNSPAWGGAAASTTAGGTWGDSPTAAPAAASGNGDGWK